ncbi:phytanoyl-CoA dioxygenase family protein [Fluviispira vulneris]|uniref:phytanoyl-CoA dioxygenase family protein n=1 Tax=Fluviispira vulneris TaxID=2763012 RepID=UPI0016461761|nr:phytanoyl-CoA dioxygenase family protein [Fluviispira vulneris]
MIKRFRKNNLGEAKDFFKTNGFIVVEDAFDQELLNDFKEEFASVIKAYLAKAKIKDQIMDFELFHKGMELLEKKDHMYVAAVYDTIFLTPSFLRIASQKFTSDIVRILLDNVTAPLYGYTNRCLIAPPSDDRRTYGWHQEVFYTIPEGRYIQTWAPLIDDTSTLNGTIEIAVGSHKEGIAPQTWKDIKGRATQIIVSDDVLAKYEKVSLPMKLGELLLFSGFLAHRSGTNISSMHRYSLVGMYHDVSEIKFITPTLNFSYRGKTPKEYYDKEVGN